MATGSLAAYDIQIAAGTDDSKQPPVGSRQHYRCFERLVLISYEGDDFSCFQDAAREILAVTAVHPMREDAVLKLLAKSDTGQEVLNTLLRQKLLARIAYHGKRFYVRRYSPRQQKKSAKRKAF